VELADDAGIESAIRAASAPATSRARRFCLIICVFHLAFKTPPHDILALARLQ
jgi:hypothetical protein